MSDLLDLAAKVVALAKAKGADSAAATAARARDVGVQWRDGRVEKVTEATTRNVALSIYVDGRYSAVSTSDLRDDALARFVEDSVAMARVLEKDPFRGLPDPKLYEGRSTADLALRDPAYDARTADQRRQTARDLEQAARDVPDAGSIVSVTTNTSDSFLEVARVTTNGFSGSYEQTSFWMAANVTLKDGDGRRPEDWGMAGARLQGDLPALAGVGKDASQRAFAQLGAKKIESARLPMIVEARSAGRLVRALLGAMTGYALQQRRSFLDGQLGKPIAGNALTMIDDPLVPKGLGSRRYDGDGIAAKRLPIVERGVLRAFYVDDYYARKLKVDPTTGGPSNLVFAAGTKGLDALAADAKEAFVVTGFLGGNSNSTTGDYSLGVQGYRVRGGKRAEPIVEMNVAGNQKDLWQRLVAVGSDPYPYSSVRTPTLVFDGVQFAGA